MIERRRQWTGSGLRILIAVRHVLIPEPLHGVASQVVTVGKVLDRWRIEGSAGNRIDQHLGGYSGAAALFRHHGDGCGHVASGAVSGNRDLISPDSNLTGVLGNPFGSRIAFFHRHRIPHFRRPIVLNKNYGCAGSVDNLADKAVISIGISQNPPAAMEVHHHRKNCFIAGRTENTQLYFALGTGRYSEIFRLCRQYVA